MPTGSRICEACGAPNPSAAGSCTWCGASLPEPAVLPPKSVAPLRVLRPVTLETYCPHCGKLYPSSKGACPRCALLGVPMWNDTKAGHCPRCGLDLVSEQMSGVTVDRCSACRGIWFDRGEIARVLDLRTRGLTKERATEVFRSLAERAAPAPAADPSVSCVRCGERMERRTIAPRSQIMVDACGRHGIWFDGGEFEAFQAFVEADGLEILRQWETVSTGGHRYHTVRWGADGDEGEGKSMSGAAATVIYVVVIAATILADLL